MTTLPTLALPAGLALLLGAGFALPPSAFADQPGTKSAGVLQVCLYPGFDPFAWKDGNSQWHGWDVEYLKGFAAANHLTFMAVEVKTFENIWLRPGNDECDVAATGISDTADRREATDDKGQWSATYYAVVRAYLVRTENKEKLKDVRDLRGKTVIVTGGSTADVDLRNRLDQAQIKDVAIRDTNNEEAAARQVLARSAFAYGGGYGSVLVLAKRLGGVAVVWPHCNMVVVKGEFKAYAEPFSFVVRAASTGLLAALNGYVHRTPYAGTGNPPEVKCQDPPWVPKPR